MGPQINSCHEIDQLTILAAKIYPNGYAAGINLLFLSIIFSYAPFSNIDHNIGWWKWGTCLRNWIVLKVCLWCKKFIPFMRILYVQSVFEIVCIYFSDDGYILNYGLRFSVNAP